jgi:hypothetical protein
MFEWQRFLLGAANPDFLLEVFARTIVTYGLLLLVIRLLGRRAAAQYTLFDLSLVVTMAAAIGVPLQASDRDMAFPMIIAVVVITLQRAVVGITLNRPALRRVIDTNISLLIFDGRICLRHGLSAWAEMRDPYIGAAEVHHVLACTCCGTAIEKLGCDGVRHSERECKHCGNRRWQNAALRRS